MDTWIHTWILAQNLRTLEPKSGDLVQGERPQISDGIGVGYEKVVVLAENLQYLGNGARLS